MEDNEIKLSKYSSGVNINLRIDQLWKDSHLHSRNGNYNKWNLDLDCIWSELARDLKEEGNKKEKIDTYENIKEDFDSFDEQIINTGRIKDNEPLGFKKITITDMSQRDKHYKILREKQIFLARLENKLGKGTSYKDMDEDSLEG